MKQEKPMYTFDEVVFFISEETGVSKINRDTLVEDDLGVTGSDGVELIQKLSKKFGVNVKNFHYAKYFHQEPHLLTVYKDIQPLTVGNLYDAIQIGTLE